MRNLYFPLLWILLFPAALLSQDVANDMVIAQMNYCINSLTNIIHNKSMPLLEHETDQLINNLTMEQMVGLYEIADFRSELLDATSKLNITEEERLLLKRVTSIKKDNMKWNALSQALSPTMLLTGGGSNTYQLAFQALLTVARSAIEYKSMQGEQQIEELNAMWDLRKEDMKEFAALRKTALNLTFQLYQKYHLSEKDRLTEETSKRFNEIITEPDSYKRVRLLKDNRDTYVKMADYYYYLGMAYVDINRYAEAKEAFDKYSWLYNKAPIFRVDEKSGCIALTRLTYERSLSNYQKEQLIESVTTNLPNSGAALVQCVLVYLNELQDWEKALNLLRSGIDKPTISDKEAILALTVNLLPQVKKYPLHYEAICDAINKCEKVELESYLTYVLHTQDNPWPLLQQTLNFAKVTHKPWYRSKWIGVGWFISPVSGMGKKIHLSLPVHVQANLSGIKMLIEEHTEKGVTTKRYDIKDESSIPIDEIREVDCFKANKNLKYLYMETIVPEKEFRIKPTIDYKKIENEEYPRQSEFTLTEDDIEDIVDFCKEHSPKSPGVRLLGCPIKKGDEKELVRDGVEYTFIGDTLLDVPHHSMAQKGEYMRLLFDNVAKLELVYKLDTKNEELIPYSIRMNEKLSFYKPEYEREYNAKAEDVKKPDEAESTPQDKSEEKESWWQAVLSWLAERWAWVVFWK